MQAIYLPVRKFMCTDDEGSDEVVLMLHEHDYLVRHEDLQHMSAEISKSTPDVRADVKYVSAPSASGKTASI